jgi:hypothetical protein
MASNLFDEDSGSQMPLLARRQFYPNKEQNDRADDRHDETRRMKRRTRFRFGKQASDQSADDGTTDTDQCRHYETEMLSARHDRACNQPDDEANNDVPNDV